MGSHAGHMMPAGDGGDTRALVITGWLTGIYFSTVQAETEVCEELEKAVDIDYLAGMGQPVQGDARAENGGDRAASDHGHGGHGHHGG